MASPTASAPSPQGAAPAAAALPPPAHSSPTGELGSLSNDPSRTKFDPAASFWLNYFRSLTGSMTAEGRFHFREHVYREREAKDCTRCEDDRDWLLQFSPTVRFLSEKITALNGKLDKENIMCKRCPARLMPDGSVHRQSGGFDPNHGILICANEIRDRKHMEDTLSHEMVHAWDHLRWKVDWYGDKDLRHAACTEIRASMLSGECRWAREFFTRQNFKLSQQFQDCVRMRAILSVQARPSCKDDVQATKVVNQVWESCFADTRPFDEVYR